MGTTVTEGMPVSRLFCAAVGAVVGAAVTAACLARTATERPASPADEGVPTTPGDPAAPAGGDFFAPAQQ